VAHAEQWSSGLDALDDAAIAAALAASEDGAARGLAGDPGIGADLRLASGVQAALESADVVGGTAPRRVAEALRAARARLQAIPARSESKP